MRGLDLDREGIITAIARRTACTGSCDDYCRCTRITGVDVPGLEIADLAARYEPDGELATYALERALTALMPWGTEDAFRFEAVGGWYGEELDGVYLEERLALSLDAQAAAMAALPDDDSRIREALLVEYGELLPQLAGATFEPAIVPRALLHLGADAHVSSRSADALAPYRRHRGITGVATERGDGTLRLLDGYHRTLATDHDPVDILIARPAGPSARRQAPVPRPRTLADAMRRTRRLA